MRNKNFQNIIRLSFLVLLSVIVLIPIYLVVIGAFKEEREIYTNLLGLPQHFNMNNFAVAWEKGNFSTYYGNTVLVTVFQVAISIPLSAIMGFVLSRRDLWCRGLVTVLLLAGLTIPAQVAIMPLFVQMKAAGLYNNLAGLVVVLVGYRLAFTTFIFQKFMSTVPVEIEEAAIIDGCSIPKLFYHICLPLSKNVISVGIIFNAMYAWNNFFFPMVLISSKNLRTISTGLVAFKGENTTQYTLLFAAIAICTIPVIIFYIFMQKYIVRGVMSGAIKG